MNLTIIVFSKILFLVLVTFSASACATILAPGPDLVSVNSEPDKAEVLLDGTPVGRTPCSIAFNRKSSGVVTIRKEGWETVIIDRDKVVNGYTFLGIFLDFGIFSIPIDAIAGNVGKYPETPIYVELQKDEASKQ